MPALPVPAVTVGLLVPEGPQGWNHLAGFGFMALGASLTYRPWS